MKNVFFASILSFSFLISCCDKQYRNEDGDEVSKVETKNLPPTVEELESLFGSKRTAINSFNMEERLNISFAKYSALYPEKALEVINMHPGNIRDFLSSDKDFLKIANENKLNLDSLDHYFYRVDMKSHWESRGIKFD